MKKSIKSLSFVDFKKIQGKRPLSLKKGRFFNLAYFNEVDIRFSFVVSKKKSKKAVSRNKIKRRSRMCLLKSLSLNELKNGLYIFNVSVSGVENVMYEELFEDIRNLVISL